MFSSLLIHLYAVMSFFWWLCLHVA